MQLSTKVLVPLATLAAAGAIAVGSGATFTSQSGNTISAVTAGSLSQLNSKDGQAVFDLIDLKPGDTLNGSLTLKNTGSLPADFGLTEVDSDNEFTGANLGLTIRNTTTGTTVYSGTFGGLTDDRNDIGVIAPGATNTFTFTVTLASTAPNDDQGATASALYAWDSVQLDGETFTQ